MNKQSLRFHQKRGFTLVELLVVVAIIGALASLVLVSFTGSQKQARDTGRKNDLRQYQNALESFANKNNGLYPYSSTTAISALCTALTISPCIEDVRNSKDPSFVYNYSANGSAPQGGATATRYVLWAKVEAAADYWVICSDGKAGSKPQANWSNPSQGACPL